MVNSIFLILQKKEMRFQSTAKYEKKIQELTDLLQRKTDECYQSWMSWTSANEQLENIRMELDNKSYQTYSLGKMRKWLNEIHYLRNGHFFISVTYIDRIGCQCLGFPVSRWIKQKTLLTAYLFESLQCVRNSCFLFSTSIKNR